MMVLNFPYRKKAFSEVQVGEAGVQEQQHM